jgi:hypothetical protein
LWILKALECKKEKLSLFWAKEATFILINTNTSRCNTNHTVQRSLFIFDQTLPMMRNERETFMMIHGEVAPLSDGQERSKA